MDEKALNQILYVEDEQDIRFIAKMALEKIGGMTVTISESGQKALDILKTFKPDLILMDVMMPEWDGPTTIKKIKQTKGFQDIPFIYMTAKVRKDEIDKFLTTGALGVIMKPFDPMTLAGEIRSIWAKA